MDSCLKDLWIAPEMGEIGHDVEFRFTNSWKFAWWFGVTVVPIDILAQASSLS
jgi:hypothetical protein